jgi:hypothetical protein
VGILLWGIRHHGEPKLSSSTGIVAEYRSLPRRVKTSAATLWQRTANKVATRVRNIYTYPEKNGDDRKERSNDNR